MATYLSTSSTSTSTTTTKSWFSYNTDLEKTVDKYFDNVRHILKVSSEEEGRFLTFSRSLLFNTILNMPPSTVRGVVIGLLEPATVTTTEKFINNKLRFQAGSSGSYIRVSVGRRDYLSDHCTKEAVETVNQICETRSNVLYLRTPFISSRYRSLENTDLITFFTPVVKEILEVIKFAQTDPRPIPILLLGLNSCQSIEGLLSVQNKPRYVMISSYHPFFVWEMTKLIKEQPQNADHLIKLKTTAVQLIKRSVSLFILTLQL